MLSPAGVLVPLPAVAEVARALRMGLRRVEIEDGVRVSKPAQDLLGELEAAGRALREAQNVAGAALVLDGGPPERLCRVCGLRPVARNRSICRSRACERDGYQHDAF